MTTLLDIIEKLQDTQAAVRMARALAAKYPQDHGVLANLESLEKRALSLEARFLGEAHVEALDVCSYRMFADDRHSYPILSVGLALSDLQRWFSTVYDALKNGPKERAKLAPEVVRQSTLDFGFAFTGSVGVAMTVPSERMLFDNDLQRAMRKIIEMGRAGSSEEVHQFGCQVGLAGIRAMSRWISHHVASGTGAEIKWLREQEEIAAAVFPAEQLAGLALVIQKTTDEMEEMLDLVGVLVGADIHKHTFHLVFPEAEEIRGTMASTIGSDYTVELPHRYRATIRRTRSISYATDEETVKYHLLALTAAH